MTTAARFPFVDVGAQGLGHVLSGAAAFHGLDRAALDDLARSAMTVGRARRHVLFRDGSPNDRIYLIVRGKAKLTRRLADGSVRITELLGPADVVDELSMFDPGPHLTTAEVVTDALLITMQQSAVETWLAQRTQIAMWVMGGVARRARVRERAEVDRATADVAGRVANALLGLAERFGVDNGRIVHVLHELTHAELGQLAGTSRESVSRVLRTFADRGWAELDRGTIRLLDPQALTRRAGTTAPAQQRRAASTGTRRIHAHREQVCRAG